MLPASVDPTTLKPGDEVIFAYADSGTEWDQAQALKHLVLNGQYAVAEIQVGSYRSDLTLEGYPGVWFNSVHFVPKLYREASR